MTEQGGMENKADPKQQVQNDIDLNLKYDKVMGERTKLEKKAFHRSFVTRLHCERKEAETEAACTSAKESQGWRTEEVKQEDLLAREMAKDKFKELTDMKLREFLRNSEELKELERKLREAYVQRDLAAQLVEKKAELLRKKCQQKEEQKLLTQQEKLSHDLDRLQKEEEFFRKSKYREDLQDQLIDRQKVREFEYKRQLEEKALLDDALRTILEEDKKEEELKLYKKIKSKEDTEAMIKARQTWIKLEKEFQEEEDRKIRKYLEDKARKEKELQEENKRKEQLRLQQRTACINKLLTTEGERLERERISQILLDEDARRKEEEAIRKENEKKLKTLLEFKEITAKQIEYRMQTTEEERRQDLEFCRRLLEENEKAMKKEQEEMMQKRLRSIEHGKRLKQLIEEQNIEKIKEMERNYFEELALLEASKHRQQLLEEERLKILKEHTKNLIGFLPKGVIKESDLPHLSPEVREFYKRRDNQLHGK